MTPEEITDTLKPCPFCGGACLRIHSNPLSVTTPDWGAYVYCKGCDASSGDAHGFTGDRAEAEAVRLWNARTPEPVEGQ